MKNEITKLNTSALANFNKALESANNALEANTFHAADWFDTPEKRLSWWFDLEPQWQRAFSEAVFYQKKQGYRPTDTELKHLFNMRVLCVTGSGEFRHRNVMECISFQLTNLSGVRNLTNLERIECDYNGKIESLEPLSKLTKLRDLLCDNNNISDLTPLMDLAGSLRSLCIWNNKIKNLEPLSSLLKLQTLYLGLYDEGNPIESLEPLRYIQSLKVLYLPGCGLTDLSPLKDLKKLHFIDVRYNGLSYDAVRQGFPDLNVRV